MRPGSLITVSASMALCLVVVLAVVALLFVRGRYVVVTVNGISMRPALEHGDRVVAVPGVPVPPDVAAKCQAELGVTVPAGSLLLLGDKPRSEDSKQRGYCPAATLLGVVLREL